MSGNFPKIQIFLVFAGFYSFNWNFRTSDDTLIETMLEGKFKSLLLPGTIIDSNVFLERIKKTAFLKTKVALNLILRVFQAMKLYVFWALEDVNDFQLVVLLIFQRKKNLNSFVNLTWNGNLFIWIKGLRIN